MSDDDADLVALIDNELDADSRHRLLARIEREADLRARYDALRASRPQIEAAFEALLARAPVDRLKAAIPKEAAPPRRGGFFRGLALRELAAGFAAGLIVAGLAALAAFNLAPGSEDDWRAAVVDYMQLYTNDTFAMPAPDRELQSKQLSAVGEKVGVQLTPDKVALPNLALKVAFILAYEGSPLAEIAFTEPSGAPVLVCVIANKSADAPVHVEKRGEFTLASWARGGHGYLVIGRLPERRAEDLARGLSERI